MSTSFVDIKIPVGLLSAKCCNILDSFLFDKILSEILNALNITFDNIYSFEEKMFIVLFEKGINFKDKKYCEIISTFFKEKMSTQVFFSIPKDILVLQKMSNTKNIFEIRILKEDNR